MIGFIVEGRSDELAVKEICRKIEAIGSKVRQTGGPNPRKAVTLSKLLLDQGCNKVIILKDTHCSDPDGVKQGFMSQLKEKGMSDDAGGRVKVCVVASAIESWMLADEEAVGDYLSVQVDEVSEPEKVHDPEEALNDVFRRYKRFPRQYFKGGTDPKEIASRLDLAKVRNKCPHYCEFEEAVRDQ